MFFYKFGHLPLPGSPPGAAQCRTLKGETPLFLAVVRGLRENATFFLQNGCSPDLQNDEQDSPLVAGTSRGTSDLAGRRLLTPKLFLPTGSYSERPVRPGHAVAPLQSRREPDWTVEQDGVARVGVFRPGQLRLFAPGVWRRPERTRHQKENPPGSGSAERTSEYSGGPVRERCERDVGSRNICQQSTWFTNLTCFEFFF